MQTCYLYILRCADRTYYTGTATDLELRIEQHRSGHYEYCYTYKRRPLRLVYVCEFSDMSFALLRERQVRKWSRAKKEALINQNFDLLPGLAKKVNFRKVCFE